MIRPTAGSCILFAGGVVVGLVWPVDQTAAIVGAIGILWACFFPIEKEGET